MAALGRWVRSFTGFVLGLVADAWRTVLGWPVHRKVLVAAALGAFIVLTLTVDLPSLATLRAWSDSAGDWFVVAFWLFYVAVTQLPVPRTFLTLASGILFGPWTGALVAVTATTVSAVVSLGVVRGLIGEWIRPRLDHPAVAGINARLRQRGWLAVGSLRMIAGVPFFVLNCACALSPVRVLPYAVATCVGSAPGTVALVFFGDTLTGHADPVVIAFTVELALVGLVGLAVDHRMPVQSGGRSRVEA